VNLIASARPEHWNAVVGQDRALRLLHCILTTAKFMPKGYIFRGPIGVGKTTCAYLMARALMCTGDDPLGCGKCASCKFIDQADSIEEGLNLCGDFMEVDAASHSGAEHMRSMLDIMNSPPSAQSRRRVLLIDESHDLSGLAWDVALKPLETKEDGSVFMFASSRSDLIPYSISSRCVPIPFERVHTDNIFGLLVNIANQKDIQYELEALKIIARKSKGIVRDAVLWLGMVASMGMVTRELVIAALDDTLEDLCNKCYASLATGDQIQAVKWIDEAGRNYSTGKVIEVMFSIYARTPWAEPGSLYAQIASRLPNIAEVDSIFIKWLSNTNLPADALPLVVYELMNTLDVPANATSRAKGGSGISSAPPMGGIIPADSIESFFND